MKCISYSPSATFHSFLLYISYMPLDISYCPTGYFIYPTAIFHKSHQIFHFISCHWLIFHFLLLDISYCPCVAFHTLLPPISYIPLQIYKSHQIFHSYRIEDRINYLIISTNSPNHPCQRGCPRCHLANHSPRRHYSSPHQHPQPH